MPLQVCSVIANQFSFARSFHFDQVWHQQKFDICGPSLLQKDKCHQCHGIEGTRTSEAWLPVYI